MSHRVPVLIAVATILSLALLLPRGAESARPLTISLSTPTSCEADYDSGAVVPGLEVDWQVEGGSAPYRVVVDGVRYSEASGTASVVCGVWQGDEVDAGIMAIQAHVEDATGSAAGALSYVYAVRVIRADPVEGYTDVTLLRGRTYRVHGVLLTAPDEFDLHVGGYRSADCAIGLAECGDRFQLHADGWASEPPYIWIRRWHADEANREVSKFGQLSADQVDDILDELIASIGQAPTAALPANVGGPGSDELSLTMIAPAICEENGPPYAPSTSVVAWEISGGAKPYRIVIDGEQVGASEGTLHVQCGALLGGQSDSGLHSVHGTVIDADGRIASNVVHTYGIKHVGGSTTLRSGETYRVSGQVITVPGGVSVEDGEHVHGHCWGTDEDYERDPYFCEDTFSIIVRDGEIEAWLSFGVDSGREYRGDDRVIMPAVDEAHPIHTKLDQIAASVGQPPALPEDHADQLRPLAISAYADPISCDTSSVFIAMAADEDGWLNSDGSGTTSSVPLGGGHLNLYWAVTGGFWTPVTVTLNGRDPSAHRMVISCAAEPGPGLIDLQASDNSDPPQSTQLAVDFETVVSEGDDELSLRAYPHLSGYCRPGETVLIGWFADYHEDLERVVTIDGLDGRFGREGTARVRCREQIGQQTVTLRAVDDASPPNRATTVVRLVVTDDPPELVELLATAAPTPSNTCAPGDRLQLLWKAIGGVAPYHVSLPGDPDATVVGDRIETDCPTEPGDQSIAVAVRDSNFRPVTIHAQVWIEVVPAESEP